MVINVSNNNFVDNNLNNYKNNFQNFLNYNQFDQNKGELNASLSKSSNRVIISNNNILSNQPHHNTSVNNLISNKNYGILNFNKIKGLSTSRGSKYG